MAYSADYFDGDTTRPQQAAVTVLADGLLIQTDGAAAAHWPFEELERIEGPASSGLRLSAECAPGARLVLRDAAAEALIDAMPRLKRAGASKLRRRRAAKWIIGGLLTATIIGFAAFEGLPRAFAYMPMRWTAPVGDNVRVQAAAVFDGKACASPDSKAALDRLAAQLLAGVDASATFDPAVVDIDIVKTKVPNAFAAPGGRLLILGGLLDLTGEDADGGGDMLAGVLAHEIAHARLRHPTRALGRSLGLTFLAQVAGASYGADLGVILAQLAYSREAEREADALAREMLVTAEIGDAGLDAFFQKLKDRFGGDGGANFLSTHPTTDERIAGGKDGAQAAFTAAEWRSLHNDCAP